MSAIRTRAEAKRIFPRGEFVSMKDYDAYPGCEIKVWAHGFGPSGKPEIGGYLYRYECDDGGKVVARHPVLHDFSGMQLFVTAACDEVAR